jgi:hypothetical protein
LFGKLANREFSVEQKKLDIVKLHIAKFPRFLPNLIMLDRLQKALDNNQTIAEADASFYFHELKEAELMEQGYKWEEAHLKAIQYYEVSAFSIYHPKAIVACPDEFNQKWKDCWGIE